MRERTALTAALSPPLACMGTTIRAAAVSVGELHPGAGMAEERALVRAGLGGFPRRNAPAHRVGKFKVGRGPVETFTRPASPPVRKTKPSSGLKIYP